MSMNRLVVYNDSKIMYHVLLFVSFILAVITVPFVQKILSDYISQNWLVISLSYLFAYLLAIYVFPEISFWVYKSSMKKA